MIVVIDASVTVKWFINDAEQEPDQEKAISLLRTIIEGNLIALQPPHWLTEVAAVLARITPANYAEESVLLLNALEIPVEDSVDVIRQAVQLASALNHHLFDTLYHATAKANEGTLITADNRYYRKALPFGHILQLTDWEAVISLD